MNLQTSVHLLTALFLVVPLAAAVQGQEKPKAPQTPPAERLKEPVAPDIKQEAVWDGRKLTPFKALDAPKMVTAKEADFLDDSDYVLGVSEGGVSKAYPTRYIWFHHVVNDKIGKPGQLVADPFMGSGTVGQACIENGMRYIGTEIDREHFEVARGRLLG